MPDIPLNARTVETGVTGDANIAVTNSDGVFNLQDVGVYADSGIRCGRGVAACDDGTQNSFLNDPNLFPNTFVSTGFTNPGVNKNTGGTGTLVNPNDADQSTRIDDPVFTGVTGNFNFTPLLDELVNGPNRSSKGIGVLLPLNRLLTGLTGRSAPRRWPVTWAASSCGSSHSATRPGGPGRS